MDKEFIPYEQALALKELDYNRRTLAQYNTRQDGKWILTFNFSGEGQFSGNGGPCVAPTFSQAFRWFRKKHGLQSYINPELSFSYNNPKYTVIFIKTTKNFTTYKDDTIWVRENIERKRFNSYEEAELECLKKLIEIVKQK